MVSGSGSGSGSGTNGGGGGIWNLLTVTATNTTISGNFSNGRGGGVANENQGLGVFKANNVTITRNTGGLGSGAVSPGGGVWNAAGSVFQFANTILADNQDASAGLLRRDHVARLQPDRRDPRQL